MKNLKDLRQDISKDEKLRKQFMNLKSLVEAVNLACNMGYNVSEEEMKEELYLNEDLLENVAGGKDVHSGDVKVSDIGQGEKSKILNTADVNEELCVFRKIEENYRK